MYVCVSVARLFLAPTIFFVVVFCMVPFTFPAVRTFCSTLVCLPRKHIYVPAIATQVVFGWSDKKEISKKRERKRATRLVNVNSAMMTIDDKHLPATSPFISGVPRCSNGVVGLDGAFNTCCSVECGMCNVSDCSGHGYDECCAAAIVAADVSCGVSVKAPSCVQD